MIIIDYVVEQYDYIVFFFFFVSGYIVFFLFFFILFVTAITVIDMTHLFTN